MNFRTEYIPKKREFQLNVEKPILLLGSCFTTSVGNRMRNGRWRAVSNPCGVLYNPMSIANVIELALSDDVSKDIEKSIIERDGRYVSWFMDSTAAKDSKKECIASLSDCFAGLKDLMKQADAMVITFGTSWIYELSEIPGYVVANCHKFPDKTFVRRRLAISEITECWKNIMELVWKECGEKKFIFTVSPIRHLRDGFEGNSLSKSILLLACAELCKLESVAYFPSFEIMNDDLRDYRFYGSDMLHPSEVAVDYIWDKFKETFISDAGKRILAAGEKITKFMMHRPIISQKDSGMQNLMKHGNEVTEKLIEFMSKYPGMRGEE